MPPLAELAGLAAANLATAEGVQAGNADAEDAPRFAELLALLAALHQLESETGIQGKTPEDEGLANGRAIEAEPVAREDTGGAADDADEAAARTAVLPVALPAPLWWTEPPQVGADAPGPSGENSAGAPPAGAAEANSAARLAQQRGEREGIPVLAAATGRSEQAGSPVTTDVPPVTPPEPLKVAEADGGRQLQAPVSLALRLEPRNPTGSPSQGNAASVDGSRAAPSGQTAAPATTPANTAARPLGEQFADVKVPAQAGEPGPSKKAEPTARTGDPPRQTADAHPRGGDVEEAAGAARAQSKPAGEAMSAATTPAAATLEAQPQLAPQRQPRAEQSSQPVAAQRVEANAPPEAPREVWLRIEPGQTGERGRAAVAIQVTERAGRVEVRVRTPDQALGESLRREMPALVERLEREGFRASAVEASAPVPPSPGGVLRIAQPEAAPAFEDEGSRGAGGQAGRQGEQREQDRAPREDGEGAPFASEVTRWLLR